MNTAISPKILVVDDTPANLVAMRRLLARCGAQLLEAGSGNEALALCLDHDFALILLDVNMPDMDGFEVAALLSETEQMRDTPIIFVTARDDVRVNPWVLYAGALAVALALVVLNGLSVHRARVRRVTLEKVRP